jgi:hypothetical protein
MANKLYTQHCRKITKTEEPDEEEKGRAREVIVDKAGRSRLAERSDTSHHGN